jgi:RNA recognition motif-containing protein
MVGVPLGCRLKIAAPLSFGSGKSVKNVSTSVVRAGLEDSIINFDYLTKNMPMTTPLPPFDTMPGSAMPGSMPYERRTPPPPPAYDSQQRSKPYERSSFLEDSPLGASPVERTTPPPPAVEEGPKLYVGNLPWTCDSQQLAEIFQDCGTVELVEVIYDRETSRSRGFGFVTMASQAEAAAAKQTLDGYMLGGRSLTVSFPQSNRDRLRPPPRREFGGGNGVGGGSFDSGNKLFVGNLSWGVDDASLQNMFSRYGTVVDARVVYDRETGRSRGFGFVTLSNADEVNEAIQNMDGAVSQVSSFNLIVLCLLAHFEVMPVISNVIGCLPNIHWQIHWVMNGYVP